MTEERIDSHDDRVEILREKARRESIAVPEDVLQYLADKAALAQTLKGSLVRVHTMAAVRGVPLDLAFARGVYGDEEPEPVPEPEPAASVAPASAPAAGAQGVATGVAGDDAPREAASADAAATAAAAAPVAPVAPQPAAAPQPADEPAFLAPPAPPAVADDEPHHIAAPEPPAVSYEPELEPDGTLFGAGSFASAEPQVAPVAPVVDQVEAAPATVWFAPMRTEKKQSLVARAGTLLERAGLGDAIEEGDLVAVKLHFGEEGNTGFVHPIYVREVVKRIREAGGRPFLTDSNTLYRGKRANAPQHIECALRNGFSFATVDAPIIIADGLDGRESVDVEIEGFDHFESVRIGAAAVHADAMVVITHVKGHEATGFGGAMKNVGMGLGCRSAKQRMHADFEPHPDAEKCTACGRCVQWCPVDAITIGPDRVAAVDYELCYGCGECVAACPFGAIAINWKTDEASIQEKIVEHVAGAVKGKEGKVVYLSFITNVTPDCDCWHFSDAAVVPDIGVLASDDIVAIEQASYDLVTEAVGLPGTRGEGMGSGVDKFTEITGIDGKLAIAYAEKHGLGTRRYDLKTLG